VGGGAGHASHAVRRNLARASQCLVHGLCPWSRPRWRLLPSVPAFWTAPYPTEQRRSAFAWWRDIERALRMAR
jgi:hypothetical protein